VPAGESVSAETIKADICVIGAGSAGLSVAAGAAQMGARTVLIEARRMGGDCLNTGCVPSKSLLAAAKVAHTVREAAHFGVRVPSPEVEFGRVHSYVDEVIAGIAPHDSVERFAGLGCTVIGAHARFVDEGTVEADGRRIKARRFIVATGSRAAVPPIPGVERVPYFTNETIVENAYRPHHLLIIGAGPIGCEMAQAHRRLGSNVTVLDLGPMLPNDDPEAAALVRQAFAAEGIALAESVKIERAEKRESGVAVALAGNKNEHWIEGSHLLVAAGRKPNVENLGLEAAGIRANSKGRSMPAFARAIGAPTRQATLLAAINSRISPTIMPASSCGTRPSDSRRRPIFARSPGSPLPTPSSLKSA
jgi:pyruvate/2-oxoglutarate dehydrogenase complex dihydrolipoamide dehydrogenase (E3) component